MRWDNLFDDLEGQLESGLALEDVDIRAEEERLRLGRLSLRDRIVRLAHGGSNRILKLSLVTGDRLDLVADGCGRDWVSGREAARTGHGRDDGHGRDAGHCVVALVGIASLSLSRRDIDESLDGERALPRAMTDRLGLSFVMRDLCRRRARVELALRRERLHGTIDRVGRDHLDLAIHERGTHRRESLVADYRMVAFSDVVVVRVV